MSPAKSGSCFRTSYQRSSPSCWGPRDKTGDILHASVTKTFGHACMSRTDLRS